MDTISRMWRDFYREILSISPMWWAILVGAGVLCLFAYLTMRGR